jgi:hypothetical protein
MHERLIYLEYDGSRDRGICPEWLARHLDDNGSECCGRGCGSVVPRLYGKPVDIPFVRRPSGPLIRCPMAAIVRRDLFEAISPCLREHVLGVCVERESRTVYDEYLTVYTPVPHGAYLRGRRQDRYGYCRHCGTHRLQGVGYEGDFIYFARSTLQPWRDAYQVGTHSTFVITSKLRDQIDWSQFPEINFYEYPLIDEPIDGRTLAGDPDYIPIWRRK